MRPQILLVPYIGWAPLNTAAVRAGLEGCEVDIVMHEDDQTALAGKAALCIVVGRNQDPGKLKTLGEAARASCVPIFYANFGLEEIIQKIREWIEERDKKGASAVVDLASLR